MSTIKKEDEKYKELSKLGWSDDNMIPMARILMKIKMLPSSEVMKIIADDLNKALSASVHDALIYGQGELEVESLESTLKNVTFNGLSKQLGMKNVKGKRIK